MKRLILAALVCLITIGLFAVEPQSIAGMFKTLPRAYTQLLVNDMDGGELPGVINKSNATAENYTLTAYKTSHPQDIMSTDSTLATVPSPANNIRIFRLGNGTSFPFVSCAWLQLGGFPSNWAAGDTIRLNLTYKPSGDKTTWDIVVPDDNTNGIGFAQKYNPIKQIVAPPWKKKDSPKTEK